MGDCNMYSYIYVTSLHARCHLLCRSNEFISDHQSQSQDDLGSCAILRHGSMAIRFLGMWVRILPGGMDVCVLGMLCVDR